MSYLESAAAQDGDRLPASAGIPLRAAVPVLLDGDHVGQAGRRTAVARRQSVLGHRADDRTFPQAALRDVVPAMAVEHRAGVGGFHLLPRLRRRCSRPTRSSACASAARGMSGLAIFLAYLVPPSILFIPLASVVFNLGLFDTRWALILTYPTFLIPFCTWLLMGYFRSIPDGAGGMRADRRRHPLADPRQDRAAAGGAGADLGRASSLSRCPGTSSSTR